jgi:hypothetical protein
MFPLQKESCIKLKIHHIWKTLTWDLRISATCCFRAGGIPILVLIKGKTTGNTSHQWQQLKVTCSAANKWPGSGLFTQTVPFCLLSRHPLFPLTVLHCFPSDMHQNLRSDQNNVFTWEHDLLQALS